MDSLILIAAIIFVIFLLMRKGKAQSGQEEICAVAIAELLKNKPDASVVTISEILKSHGFDQKTAGQVTRMVRPRLVRARIRREDMDEAMERVRQAKHLL